MPESPAAAASARALTRHLDHDALAVFYRDLHQHPELSMDEHRTASKLADQLRSTGMEVRERIGGTGVVGVLHNGEGPVVWLCADMDALPVQEATGLAFASAR